MFAPLKKEKEKGYVLSKDNEMVSLPEFGSKSSFSTHFNLCMNLI